MEQRHQAHPCVLLAMVVFFFCAAFELGSSPIGFRFGYRLDFVLDTHLENLPAFGNLQIWELGIRQKSPGNENSRISICSAESVRKVLISRKETLLTLLGVIP